MKRLVAISAVLEGLVVAGVLVRRAEERDREYQDLIGQGEQALSQGQTSVAIQAFSGAAALKPDSMLAFLKRGEAHQRQGDLREALRDLRMASQLDPGATRVLEQLGDVNQALRRYARAAESYEAYLKLDDQSPAIYYKLAIALRSGGRLGRAVAALEQAIKHNDRFAEAHYLLGLCLRDRHELAPARAALERAIGLSPALIPARESSRIWRALNGDSERDGAEAPAALDPGRAERSSLSDWPTRAAKTDLAVMAVARAVERFPTARKYAGEVLLRRAGAAVTPRGALKRSSRSPVPTRAARSLTLYGRAHATERPRAEWVLRQASEKRRPIRQP